MHVGEFWDYVLSPFPVTRDPWVIRYVPEPYGWFLQNKKITAATNRRPVVVWGAMVSDVHSIVLPLAVVCTCDVSLVNWAHTALFIDSREHRYGGCICQIGLFHII